jgi:CSLREA domain-containing protein
VLAPPDSPSRGTRAAAIVAALVCGLIGLVAVPALASAAPIVVNSTGDAPKKPAAGAVCETATPGECTLRAAIQAANAEATFSAIEFSSTVFEGQVGADEIEPATSLPPITEPASLAGPTCSGGTYKKPCVGVTALPVEVALKVR